MFCPKCGQQNPESGKFCRACGTDLGNVSSALATAPLARPLVNSKGRPISLEGAITKAFTGLAFLTVACVLGLTGAAGGRGWWFWLLIPAFTSLGAGVAQYVQIRQAGKGYSNTLASGEFTKMPSNPNASLPPPQTAWAAPESKYKTGDRVPPSVTDSTTRHLEMDSESKTQALPTKDRQ